LQIFINIITIVGILLLFISVYYTTTILVIADVKLSAKKSKVTNLCFLITIEPIYNRDIMEKEYDSIQ
jgi:hypothetical protein